MASGLVNRLNAFLDLEAHGAEYTEVALGSGYDFLGQEKNTSVYRRDSSEIAAGEQQSFRSIQGKVFPNAEAKQFTSQDNEHFSAVRTKDGDLDDTPATRFAGRLYSKGRMNLIVAEEYGVPPEEALAKIRSEMEQDRIAELREPKLHRFLLRKFISRLDQMVDDLERLEVLPVNWEFVPSQLQTLLTEAHESWLLGQDVSTAVLCGAALEESLKLILGRDKFWKLSGGIDLSVPRFLCDPSPALTAARMVCAARNDAVHDPAKYLSRQQRSKTDVLHNARFVISHIFSESSK